VETSLGEPAVATAWYYFKGEQRIGPVSPQQLKGLVLEGKLKRTDSVWKEGMSNAVPAEKVQGLFETANRAPGTSPRKSLAENKPQKVEWYYAKGDQRTGPLPLARLLKLATAGELRPGDLVWNESLSGWVRAAEVAELAAVLAATPKAPADSGPASRNSLKASLEDAKGILKKGSLSVLPAELNLAGTGEAKAPPLAGFPATTHEVTGEAPSPARLPEGLQLEDVVAQCAAAYRGGHPLQTDAGDGRLYLAKTGVHFVGTAPSHDITISAAQILNVLTPSPGTFPQEMIAQAKRTRAVAGMGKKLASLAGNLVGGEQGFAIHAIGATASSLGASMGLGPPPRNRLIVVAVASGTRHKLVFDVMASDRQAMEQHADDFWRKVASVRAAFGSAAPKKNPAVADSMGAASLANQAGYFLARAGVISGPHSDADIRQMLEKGELTDSDMLRVETWLPVSVLTALSPHTSDGQSAGGPTAQGGSGGPAHKVTGPAGQRHPSAAGTMLAAGVGGIVAGAAAAALLAPNRAVAAHGMTTRGRAIVGLDRDGDGRVDAVGADTDGDGRFDTVGMDQDGDGDLDAIATDTDRDGTLDTFGVDTDDDGQLDAYGLDADGDGDIDAVGHDYDQDGDIDDFASLGGMDE